MIMGDDFEKAIEATVLKFKEGDIVEGTIVSVDSRKEPLVDVGYKSEGLIPGRELSIRNNIDPKEVRQRSEIEVEVGSPRHGGRRGPDDPLQEARHVRACLGPDPGDRRCKDETVEGTVIEVVKGGLIVDIGLRGFLARLIGRSTPGP